MLFKQSQGLLLSDVRPMLVGVGYAKAEARADVGTIDAIYIRRNPLNCVAGTCWDRNDDLG